jgi:hypothetical protein
VKFGKIFGQPEPSRLEDPFGILPLCQNLGLAQEARSILKTCRPSVAIDVAEPRSDLSHTASYLGGRPALPHGFGWPRDSEGEPLKFLGQLSCSELSLARLAGLPDQGLLSVFMDALDDEPGVAHVYYFSLEKDLSRRPQLPGSPSAGAAYRPTFHTIPSLPRPGSLEYDKLRLSEDGEDAYYQLLLEIENSLEPCQLRCGGHAPFSDEQGCYPERGGGEEWDFFLAVRDVDELGVAWPETGAAMLWIPRTGPAEDGRAELTWQVVWDDDEDDDEDDDDEEYEERD